MSLKILVIITSICLCITFVFPVTSTARENDTRFVIRNGVQEAAEFALAELEDVALYWSNPQALSLKFVANAYHVEDLDNYRYSFFEVLDNSGKWVGQVLFDLKTLQFLSYGGSETESLEKYPGMLRVALRDFLDEYPDEENYKIVYDGIIPVFVLSDGKAWIKKGDPLVDRIRKITTSIPVSTQSSTIFSSLALSNVTRAQRILSGVGNLSATSQHPCIPTACANITYYWATVKNHPRLMPIG